MKKQVFPWIASGIGLVMALVLARMSVGIEQGEQSLPSLTLLFISEVGFLLTAGGAWMGITSWWVERKPTGMLLASLGCLVLALGFLYKGLWLWRLVSAA